MKRRLGAPSQPRSHFPENTVLLCAAVCFGVVLPALCFSVSASPFLTLSNRTRPLWSARRPSADFRRQFFVNTKLLEDPFTPYLSISDALLEKFEKLLIQLQSPSHTDESSDTSFNFSRAVLLRGISPYHIHHSRDPSGHIPQYCRVNSLTYHCCREIYLVGTVQYRQCIAYVSNSSTIPFDPFNILNDRDVYSCILSDNDLLYRCCFWLSGGESAFHQEVKQCVRVRRNIIRRAIRVCSSHHYPVRNRCCLEVFVGRPSLIKQCQTGSPTYVDRRAPCVFISPPLQRLCCAHIYPRTGNDYRVKPFHLCINAVHANRNRTLHCSERRSRHQCCKEQLLFGYDAYDTCLANRDLPCRHTYFFDRLHCCKLRYVFHSKHFVRCVEFRFFYCQYPNWMERLTCCAMAYRIGSWRLNRCVYGWMGLSRLANRSQYWDHCKHDHPPGSETFEYCLLFPFATCRNDGETPYSEDVNMSSRHTCCAFMFPGDEVARRSCIAPDMNHFDILRAYLEEDPGRVVKPLSDRTKHVQVRVRECDYKFTNYSRWMWMACLSEMRFRIRMGGPTHFTLYRDDTRIPSAEKLCAIYDNEERETCCLLHFAATNAQVDVCMSWRVEKYVDSMQKETGAKNVSKKESDKYMDLIMKSVSIAEAKVEQDGEIARSVNRDLLVSFLLVMKAVENEYREFSGITTEDESLAELDNCFKEFQHLFREAVLEQRAAILWFIWSLDWAGCVTVGLEGRDRDEGVTYCGMLGTLGGEDLKPIRDPLRGWEAGAVNELMKSIKESHMLSVSRRYRRWRRTKRGVWNRAGMYMLSSAGAVYEDRGDWKESWRKRAKGVHPILEKVEVKEESRSAEVANYVVSVSLFGAACRGLNLGYVCNAFCCDDYHAFLPACNSIGMVCIN